jgi:glycogen phosphorylase
MKVAPNGGINVSVLDGWWVEGYAMNGGWAIGAGEEYADHEHQDQVESRSLYDLLEREIAPLFYDRGRDGLPRGWIERMKQSMASVSRAFNTARMVAEYNHLYYLPADAAHKRLTQDNGAPARALAAWRKRFTERWEEVAIGEISANDGDTLPVGEALKVSARVRLGKVAPEEVQVQVYYGALDHETGSVRSARTAPMKIAQALGRGDYQYAAEVPCNDSGRHGFAVRVTPYHKDLINIEHLGMMRWS